MFSWALERERYGSHNWGTWGVPLRLKPAGICCTLMQVVCSPRGSGQRSCFPQHSQAAYAPRKITCACSRFGGSCYLWHQDHSSGVFFPCLRYSPFGSAKSACISPSWIVNCSHICFHLQHSCHLWRWPGIFTSGVGQFAATACPTSDVLEGKVPVVCKH